MNGVLVVAHGSRDPRAGAVAHDVAAWLPDVVGSRSGIFARAAFLELAAPDPSTALDDLVSHGVGSVAIVPFLLGRAYHAKTDLPDVVQAAQDRRLAVRMTGVLGPDPLLATLLARRINETGESFDALVLAAAGSSDPEGNAGVFTLADELSDRFGVPVTAGFASAAQPDPGTAVRQAAQHGRVVVATYLLAPGYFADRIIETSRAAGAVAVAEPLGAAPEIVRLVANRYRDSG